MDTISKYQTLQDIHQEIQFVLFRKLASCSVEIPYYLRRFLHLECIILLRKKQRRTIKDGLLYLTLQRQLNLSKSSKSNISCQGMGVRFMIHKNYLKDLIPIIRFAQNELESYCLNTLTLHLDQQKDNIRKYLKKDLSKL